MKVQDEVCRALEVQLTHDPGNRWPVTPLIDDILAAEGDDGRVGKKLTAVITKETERCFCDSNDDIKVPILVFAAEEIVQCHLIIRLSKQFPRPHIFAVYIQRSRPAFLQRRANGAILENVDFPVTSLAVQEQYLFG